MALTNTGYQAAATEITWTGQGANLLTDNEWTDLSDAIDNSTNKYVTVDILLALGSAAFTGSGSSVEVYVVRSVDGTNYGSWAGNVTADEQENNQYFVGSVTTSGATAAQELILSNVVVPPGLYKIGLRNRSNATLAAANTISFRPHSFEDA